MYKGDQYSPSPSETEGKLSMEDNVRILRVSEVNLITILHFHWLTVLTSLKSLCASLASQQ